MPSRSGKFVTLLVFLSFLLSRLNAPAAEDNQIDILNSQLKSLLAKGQYQEAIPIAEKLVALCEQILGLDSTDTATALNNLAVVYSTLGDYGKAEQVQLRALEIYEKHFGTGHPATARIMANLAGTYQAMGRYDEADRLFTAALAKAFLLQAVTFLEQAKSGERVMGLRRGFIEAGVQNPLMTLWPINDETTVQIVTDFYKAAHQSGNAPDALAQVQRDWLVRLRQEQGLARAVNLAGPFIMSSQGKPE